MPTPKAFKRLLSNGSLLVLLVLFVIIVTSVYVSSEHTFYWWDYSNYQNHTRDTARAFLESPNNLLYKAVRTLYRTWKSTGSEFGNVTPTVALFPFLLIFGDSRLVYIVSIALVYLLPFALVLGAIATKLIPFHPRAVFWSTALLTLLIPTVWAPTLRGYPDTGGALLIALAILVYLQDFQLKNRWQIALIGFSIAAAIVFRRHFIYGSLAFFVAIALQTVLTAALQMQQRRSEALRNLFKSSVQIGWTVAVSLISLVVLGLPFIASIVTTNYSRLYASYEVSFSEGLQYYGLTYGLAAWILAGLGFTLGYQNRVLSRPVAIFIVIFGTISLLQWLLFAKQPNLHYNLHFALFVVLGLAAFGWTAWTTLNKSKRTLVLAISGVYLLFNVFIGLASVDTLNNTPIRPTRFSSSYSGMGYSGDIVFTKLSTLFSAHYPPLKHPDYDELVRLGEYLATVSSGKEPIYIAGSSELFNDSVVYMTDFTLQKQQRLNILFSPNTDSGDFYPLEHLLQAQYVVVATPFQHHLRVEEQDVVKVGVVAFTENWEIAQDFTRLPVQFTLANGAVVNVYKRSRPTSLQTALHTLIAMQHYVGTRPGRQSDWLSLSKASGHYIEKKRFRGFYSLFIQEHPEHARSINQEPHAASFLYINKLPAQARLIGNIKYANKQCMGTKLRLDTINAQGEVINTAKLDHRSTDAPEFTLPIQARNAVYLLFNISINDDKNKLINKCLMTIEPLSVEG